MTVEALAERALRPLDGLRQVGLRALAMGGPVARAIARRRSTRTQVVLSAHALLAFALAVFAPPLLMVAGPLALAVPHLAADVRHLLIRRAWPRGWLVVSGGFAVVLVTAQALQVAGLRQAPSLAVGQGIGAAWVVLGAAGGACAGDGRRLGRARTWLALGGSVALAAVAVVWPRAFRMALVHGHNLVAVALWVWLFQRKNRLAWVPVAIVVAGGGLLVSGALIPFTVRHGVLVFADLHLFAAADWLAPGLADRPALALTMAFAFLQSAHYAIWLVGVPAGDRPGEGGHSVRAAARAFVGDLRPAGAAAVIVATVAVAAIGLFQPALVRRLVLSLGMFHAWLELAVLAYLAAAGPPTPVIRTRA